MAEEAWLDAEAAAAYLGLRTRLVYATVNAGQVPALRFPQRFDARTWRTPRALQDQAGELAHLDPNATLAGWQSRVTLHRQGHA